MTNKELQEILIHYPDDMPVAVFRPYMDSQFQGDIIEVINVSEDYLGDVNNPSSVDCLVLEFD